MRYTGPPIVNPLDYPHGHYPMHTTLWQCEFNGTHRCLVWNRLPEDAIALALNWTKKTGWAMTIEEVTDPILYDEARRFCEEQYNLHFHRKFP